MRERNVPPWEGCWARIWFKKGKNKDAGVMGNALSEGSAFAASVREAWVRALCYCGKAWMTWDLLDFEKVSEEAFGTSVV